jgi:sodium-dependent dicarboxylate transporter 2/3/5
LDNAATFVPLGVLFLTAYLMSKAYLSSGAATPLIERMADYTGHRPEQILLGYLFLVAGFSMILPNVIAAMAFVPLLPMFIDRFKFDDELSRKRITTAFALATIWGANIGGMGAIIGGLSNPILLVYAKANAIPGSENVNFVTWFYFGIPIVVTLIVTCWAVMRLMLARDFAATHMSDAYAGRIALAGSLGAARVGHHLITPDQKRVYWSTLAFMVFWTVQSIAEEALKTNGLLVFRAAPMVASVLFGLAYIWFVMLRKTCSGRALVTWAEAWRLPWRGIAVIVASMAVSLGLIYLFDVGAYAGALARAAHGADVPDILVLFGMITLVAIATEFLNNVVVALAFFPIIHQVSGTLGFPPMALLVAASLMSTAPFVLPTGAPSNALVIGETRGFQFGMAIRVGLVMAALTVVILTLYGMYFIPRVLGV